MGCALAIVFQVRSLYVPTKNRSPSQGHFWESLVILITLEIGQNHLRIEAQCGHHSVFIHLFRANPRTALKTPNFLVSATPHEKSWIRPWLSQVHLF